MRGEEQAREVQWMRRALLLARRGYGWTSPNPMVGAVLVKEGKVIGQGWHRQAGKPHAEIEAIEDARQKGNSTVGSTLIVTLEPCSTQGRTPPCTEAIKASGISEVVAAATDPNPKHQGRGFEELEKAGIPVTKGILADESTQLNESFNHWIQHRTPFVTVKAAMSADGKIATASGESRWITGEKARAFGMKLRQGADAILVGINTVLKDDPQLAVRAGSRTTAKRLRRIILDAELRTPLGSRIIVDERPELTTLVVSENVPHARLVRMNDRVKILRAPSKDGRIDVAWLLAQLGEQSVTNLLVEGGAEVNASFLLGGFCQRIAFFYAPKIIGGQLSPGAVGGPGVEQLSHAMALHQVEWRRLGPDLLLTARLSSRQPSGQLA